MRLKEIIACVRSGIGSAASFWLQEVWRLRHRPWRNRRRPTPDSASLESRVEELDQQVRMLQRLRELAADSAAAAAKDKVSATASGKDGFSIKSADGKFA